MAAPDGTPLCVSDVEPGSTSDITIARIHTLPALYKASADGPHGLPLALRSRPAGGEGQSDRPCRAAPRKYPTQPSPGRHRPAPSGGRSRVSRGGCR
ncbi:hypothetical protein [Streptomyces sp. FIT100]|uniref:hypothetical protein n=1 Tax=Streptomyces sp. FIT100 TaxID=2837956 RepID=UPI0037D9BDA4